MVPVHSTEIHKSVTHIEFNLGRELISYMFYNAVWVHEMTIEFGQENNFVLGANIAGFRRVADAEIEQGIAYLTHFVNTELILTNYNIA